MAKVCEYFFAPVSPYTYLGHDAFVALARRHHVQLLLKPFDLGRVLPLSGGLPVSQRAPQRQNYRLVELKRWSEFRNLPVNLSPRFFPVSGELASRLIVAVQLAHGTDRALALVKLVAQAVWVDEANIADEATLARLAESLELDGATLLKAAMGANVQSTVVQHTDEAIAAGVFGSPWYVYDGEPFWGQDRLDFVERAFSGA